MLCEERGMDMLATAVAMSVGAGPATIRSVSSGSVENEGISFARSFDEHVALAVDAEAKTASSQGVVELPDPKSGASLNIADDLVGAAALIKGQTAAVPVVESPAGDGNSVSASNSLDVAGIASDDLQSRTTFEKVLAESGSMTNVAAAKNVDAATDASSGLVEIKTTTDSTGVVQNRPSFNKVEDGVDLPTVQEDFPAEIAMDASSMQKTSAGVPDPLIALRYDEGHAVQNETTGAVKQVQEGSTKKVSRKQETAAKAVTSQKGAGVGGSVTEVVAKPAGISAVQGVMPVSVSIPVAAVPPGEQQKGMDKAPQGSSGTAALTGRQIAAAQPVAVDGKGGKQVHAAKESADSAGLVVSTAGDTPTVTKSGSEFEKAMTSSSAAGSDGDAKLQSVAVTTSPTHAVAEVTGAVSGLIAGAVSVHVAGDVTSLKTQSGDVNAHAATAHAGSGEQDGSGAALSSVMDGTHRTLIATPNVLEVGVPNGTQGWLKIRAEMSSGGVVNASLSAASSTGQEMLHRELPSLTAYLQQERVAVNTVVVHPEASGAELRGLAGGAGGGASGQAQQRNGQGGDGQQGVAGVTTNEVAYEEPSAIGTDELLSPLQYAGGGSWLSVRA